MDIKILLSIIIILIGIGGDTTYFHVNGDIIWTPVNNTIFDYIVVGGGSSGSIVATRLTLNGSNVLLIEGGDGSTAKSGGNLYVGTKGSVDSSLTYIPDQILTKYDVPLYWSSAYITGSKWPIVGAGVAKVLGGCAMHNGMVFQRGRQQDYDAWGVPGWGWSDLEPYFRKVENITDPLLATSPIHGHSGRIQVGSRPFDAEGQNFLQACNASGLPFNADFQSPSRDGCGYFQFNIDQEGIRSSPFHEYLEPTYDSPSPGTLHILKNSQVLKLRIVNIEGTPTAIGVYALHNTTTIYFSASHEIVLAAGSLNTPKILLQSGIGNSTYLASYSSVIPKVWSDLPGVGRNLQNHMICFTVWSYANTNTRPDYYQLFTNDFSYSTSGQGILGTPGFSVGAWLRPNATANYTENIMLVLPGVLGTITPFPSLSLGISLSRPKPNNTHYVYLTTDTSGSLVDFLSRPTSLHFTLLNQQDDVNTLVRGVKESRRIMSYSPMNTLAAPVSPSPTATDSDIESYVRTNTITHDHWSGTCRMGSSSSPLSVVDNQLKVIGINNLRIVDASIFPVIPDSLVHATVMAVAEKASDLIIASKNNNNNNILNILNNL